MINAKFLVYLSAFKFTYNSKIEYVSFYYAHRYVLIITLKAINLANVFE